MLVGWISSTITAACYFPSFILPKLRSYLYCHLQPCPCPPCSGPLPPHSGTTSCTFPHYQTCSCLKNLLYFLSGTFPVSIHNYYSFTASQLKCHLLREIFLVHFFSYLLLVSACLSISSPFFNNRQFHCIHIMVAFGAGIRLSKQTDFLCYSQMTSLLSLENLVSAIVYNPFHFLLQE